MNIKIFTEHFPWKYDLNIPEFSADYLASDYCTLSGKYHIYLKKDVNSPVKVGFFSAQKLFMNIADLHGLQPFLVMDELSQEWCTIYSVISSEIWEQNIIPNILLLDRLLIYPEFRGKNCGLLAIKAIVEACLEKGDIIALLSYPIHDDGSVYTAEEQDNILPEQELALERFYKKAGFSNRKYQGQWTTYEDVIRAVDEINPKEIG